MSQEKVDKYKKEKANRKKVIASKKKKNLVYVILGSGIGFLFLMWIVFSILWNRGILDNPFVRPTKAATISAEELQSIRDHLGITTTYEGQTFESTTTTAEGATTTVESATTTVEGATTTVESATTE